MKRNQPLITPAQLKEKLPLGDRQKKSLLRSRQTITNIIDGKDPRLLMIVGPCSIHDTASAKEFAYKLKEFQNEVEDTFYLVMRVYLEKPRTTIGWKGYIYDPFLDGSHQIEEGLHKARELLLDFADQQIPAGTEFLDPLTSHYYSDLISWGSIGARTVSSQVHRQFASGLSIPMGFKNNTDGNIHTAIHAMISAAAPHSHISIDEKGQLSSVHTEGNLSTHLVLRGGEKKTNYDKVSVAIALKSLREYRLPARVMIDCSHDNSLKRHDLQPLVFQTVISQYCERPKSIIGAILESHLSAGSQSLASGKRNLKYGMSVTDNCIDFATTERLLWQSHLLLKNCQESPTIETLSEASVC